MAKKPTHYKITVNRHFEFAAARFRPGARYTIKASVYDALVAEHPGVVASADPVQGE